ncbi:MULTISPECIES: phage tail tip fiber protein [unclassified Pseudomonas]|uniref:phage tail tip fiber protein n=1 Tax=unclassified Pseudomonas TaxID=196821 RepID=UPI003BA227FF
MSDPQIHSLVTQVQANTAQIQAESSARAVADGVLDKRIGALETVLTGSIQSSNYVPGVSGWKLNPGGDFEINSCTLGSAANAPERQMVSVEVASWSKYDLPKNAANLLQFMQAELQRVPEEYRHAAEFEEFDASYGDELFNARLFLSYCRLETEEELAHRLEKAKVAGTRINLADGVLSISHDGVLRAKISDLQKGEQPQPFVVIDGVTYISEAAITNAMIDSKVSTNWSVKMQVNARGQHVAAGIGLGLPSQFLVQADRFAINDRDASDILRDIASKIGETSLGQDLKERIDLLVSNRADQVKALIRKELMPGGLLHRSR